VVGLLPVTGIPLPFVSFGGSALITTMLATGILVNVARQGRATPARTDSARSPRPATARR
jgi:cell division protein FtsW (lipid II flippase)